MASTTDMKTRTARRSRRARQRGAALVEAAVVIPVLLVFVGLIVFTHRSYATKIQKQTTTRASTLSYASHACTNEAPEGVSTEATDNGLAPPSDADQAGQLGKTNGAGGASAVNKNGNLAKSVPPPTTVNGSAVQDRRTVSLTRSISAGSEVACNEPIFENKWTAVFKEAGSFFSSRAGF